MQTILETTISLTDLLQRIEGGKNICLTTGTGNDSWNDTLAWDPVEILKFESDDNADKDLSEFISRNTKKRRLIIGYISYNYGYRLLGAKRTKPDTLNLPGLFFCSYDNFVHKKAGFLSINYVDLAFKQRVQELVNNESNDSSEHPAITFTPEAPIPSYGSGFESTKSYIKKGHVYQINLTHKLTAKTDRNPKEIFSDLAQKNLAGMMGYIEGPDFEILSVSPERFIRINGNNLETFPIKGTRPRSKDDNENKKMLAGLISNQKELSELSMITDLLRNDVGKVCETGSVRVEQDRGIQTLSGVFHTYSKVVGTLKNQISPIEAVLSMFPGGSITGCPKKRAVEIIDEIETSSRGIYCGSMIKIDPSGNLDSNILIRTIVKKGDRLNLGVGGGIVFDSEEKSEYQETLDKANPIIKALS